MEQWNKKPYHSLDFELRRRFGGKVYKIALNGGMTCPNRDGVLGERGCIFCSAGGSGEFAEPAGIPIARQIENGRTRIQKKLGKEPRGCIAYFQSFTNTYAPAEQLEALFTEAISHPLVRALSIATRPDCLPPEVIALCSRLNRIKPVWIELGLQTIHPATAAFIRRGYPLSCFQDALSRLREENLETIVHVILGLPGETRQDMLQTVSWLGSQDIQGIKLQLLHVLKGTDLGQLWQTEPFPVMELEEYVDLVIDCIGLLPPSIVIHRLTGDGPKSLLLAPLWSADKKRVLNTLSRRLKERGVTQGCLIPQP